MSKKVSQRFTFPVAKLIFPYIVTPDTEYGEVYQVTICIPTKEQADELVAKMESKDARLKGTIKYTERDGEFLFKVKQKKHVDWMQDGERKSAVMKPIVLTSDNKPYDGPNPWGGSTGEVGILIETQKGARGKGTITALRLRGVRLHEIVSGGDGEDDPLFGGGFTEEEDKPEDVFGEDFDDEDAPI
ncbi:ORF.31 [Pseudomonas phage PaP3]|uniref:DNA binding protein n=3 Tax=Bruynoghevirus PaP3 TaxID=188350 RepID=A0A6G9LIE5_9CAUD|nr:Gp2.5-like ssDNA binding protein and ssDNA annealing protein [Pseudomonas phage PaP3]YP_007183239.1 Gp2.5-like ssDNA binding protein and ssDNA annealing protein [Pseudomonas phage vB_PaeP_p2-10_Or1]QIQ64394.1 hypothetical protein Epa1_p31 [Pseudomonas phage Epa1]QYC95389.1 hypothetical protein [Pseudomonas phage PhL_UNISO_PA-DSM_ph0041x]WIC41690.1 helix-destabilizing protein [Pseudomonas phage HZ2201]CCM43511.1 hypothetical protein BN377_1-14_Or1_orf_31 [Pseudomonas phage vB_PaeP_C1-14_Or]